MTFRPNEEVISAATESTKKYFNYLTDNRRGASEHSVINLTEKREPILIEGKTHSLYLCKLPSHVTIIPDSPATFIPNENKTFEIPVHIVAYNRKNGDTELAFKKKIDSRQGTLLIDFRWLVQRCLEWFENCGNRISFPINLNGQEINWILAEKGFNQGKFKIPSEEQIEAIKMILKEKLSFSWGPPGTGKTKIVLAKAAHAMVDQGKKSIVLAPTNNAVDNALTAILEDDVSRNVVARLGIPSDKFLNSYPECCETKAFEEELKSLNDRLENLKNKQKIILQVQKIENIIRTNKDNLKLYEKKFQDIIPQTDHQNKIIPDIEDNIIKLDKALSIIRSELSINRQKLNELNQPEIEKKTHFLENEYVTLRERVEALRKERLNLNLFQKIFTGKPKKLDQDITRIESELPTLASSLDSFRKQLEEVDKPYKDLKTIIYQDETKEREIDITLSKKRIEIENARNTLIELKNQRQYYEDQIQKLHEETNVLVLKRKELIELSNSHNIDLLDNSVLPKNQWVKKDDVKR